MNDVLHTDLYQITMAAGYFHHGMHDRPACFHLYYRRPPFGGTHVITAGLRTAVDWLTAFEIDDASVDHLATLTGGDDKPLLAPEFLRFLRGRKLTVDVDAMPEGTAAFPRQPIVRVTGPLWQCQWIESFLLCVINFQTLIATKAARVCDAAGDDPVLEFGMRRAQGIDGAMSASRAAFIGGCAATSHVAAGRRFGIPVRGTHAHSWVMSFDDEPTAFDAYADAMPNNGVFLVDTHDTIQGVENAIRTGRRLSDRGHRMIGIRLDSGDLAELSIRARRRLDESGFADAAIVASNDLDEHRIADLKRSDATIGVWGVGTRLVTGGDTPALGGVYKLGAIRDNEGRWVGKRKHSDDPIKASIPGRLGVRRTNDGDTIHDIDDPSPPDGNELVRPVLRNGRVVEAPPELSAIRSYAASQRRWIADHLDHPCRLSDALKVRL